MPLVQRAPAKINLTLRVTGRRADGYHTLESLVAFADLADDVTLEPGGEASLTVTGKFAEASGVTSDNLVLRAERTLRQQIGDLKSGAFSLTKNIPVAAGLGGGSSDAAAALRLLAELNGLALNDPRLMAAARHVGADVPVCLDPRARIMRGIGDELSSAMTLPKLNAVLVNPGVAVPTKSVFAAFDPRYAGTRAHDGVPDKYEPFIAWLGGYANDLTDAASRAAPVIRDVLAMLSAQIGCRVARMSGSGATCFALFDGRDESEHAAEQIQRVNSGWWVKAVAI